MGLWQIIDTDNGRLEDQWDDGLTLQPWEDGFTVDRIREYAGAENFNLLGVPNWTPPVVEDPDAEGSDG